MVNSVKRSAAAIFLLSLLMPVYTEASATVGFRALIGSNTDGCSVVVPERTLNFSALKTRNLNGGITTHEILPLQIALFCQNANSPVIPSLTVTGSTPYTGTSDTVFLDGPENGAGFMVRRSDGGTPSLTDFYNTGEAVANNGEPVVMTLLDSGNSYYSEETFLVGLVGPLGSSVVPGAFSASLVVNVLFQ
ncbi:fimbrial protein [Morganella morganii]